MNRRGFLGAILAAASAPAIVRAESLMKIMVPKKEIITLSSEIILSYPIDDYDHDANDLQGLIFTTHKRVTDEAIASLLQSFHTTYGLASRGWVMNG
jgi:hypothetical protein